MSVSGTYAAAFRGSETTGGGPSSVRLRVFFPEYQSDQFSTQFAFVCGLGTRAQGDYVFVRPGAMQELRERGQQFFERALRCEDADLVSYPHSYAPGLAVDRTMEVADRHQLPCVFFSNADRSPPTRLRYGVIFRESIFASRQTSCELPQPAVVDDLLIGQEFVIRDKHDIPVVGFRGFQGTGRHRELLRWLLLGTEASLGSYLRKKALRQCGRSSKVQTRFELLRFGRIYENRDQLRELYIRNIQESDYVLCIRGAGNFSFRLYETLCLGRIPVVPNTDLTLPLADRIDWPRHCVWIEPRDFGRIPDRIREFHDSLSPDQFRQLQRDNRALWKTHLDAPVFWRQALGELVRRSTPATTGTHS
jgi:hypothetical protein